MPHMKTEPMTDRDGRVICVMDPKRDRLVPIKVAVLKHSIPNGTALSGNQMVEIVSVELDINDALTPIRQILADQEHELNPETACIKGNRRHCILYDQVLKVSNEFIEGTPAHMQKRVLRSPELVLMSQQPPFCMECLLAEHRHRKRENRSWRRFARWLKTRPWRSFGKWLKASILK